MSAARTVAGDFNGDGFADIALTGVPGWNTIPVAFSNGDGTFRGTNLGVVSGDSGFTGHATASGVKIVAGDFNGDGLADIALTGVSGWNTIPVAFSNGDGTFRATNLGVTGGDLGFSADAVGGTKTIAGDFNGDGRGDIALTGGSGWKTMPVAFSNGDGTFRGSNQGETSGDLGFSFDATGAGVDAVTK